MPRAMKKETAGAEKEAPKAGTFAWKIAQLAKAEEEERNRNKQKAKELKEQQKIAALKAKQPEPTNEEEAEEKRKMMEASVAEEREKARIAAAEAKESKRQATNRDKKEKAENAMTYYEVVAGCMGGIVTVHQSGGSVASYIDAMPLVIKYSSQAGSIPTMANVEAFDVSAAVENSVSMVMQADDVTASGLKRVNEFKSGQANKRQRREEAFEEEEAMEDADDLDEE